MIKILTNSVFVLLILSCFGINLNAQSIEGIDPNEGLRGSQFPVIITGSGTDWQYTPYTYFYINFSGIGDQPLEVNVLNLETLATEIIVQNNAPDGYRDISIHHYTGNGEWEVVEKADAFSVLPSQLVGVSPSEIAMGESVSITINGENTNWVDPNGLTGASEFIDVYFDEEVEATVTNIKVVDPNTITADLTLTSAPEGPSSVYVYYLVEGFEGGARIDVLEASNSPDYTGFTFTEEIQQPGTAIELPKEVSNFAIFPNPYTERVEISYTLNQGGIVVLELFDMDGKKVATLADSPQPIGTHQHLFYAAKDQFKPGAYILRMSVNGQQYSQTLLKMK